MRLRRAQVRGRPLLMTDRAPAAEIAGAALDLALELRDARDAVPWRPSVARPADRDPRGRSPATTWPTLVVRAAAANGCRLADGDVLVVSSKVVSKALGLWAADRDAPRSCASTRRVVAERDTAAGVTPIVEAVAGPVMAAAGVDASNTGGRRRRPAAAGRPRRGGAAAAAGRCWR